MKIEEVEKSRKEYPISNPIRTDGYLGQPTSNGAGSCLGQEIPDQVRDRLLTPIRCKLSNGGPGAGKECRMSTFPDRKRYFFYIYNLFFSDFCPLTSVNCDVRNKL